MQLAQVWIKRQNCPGSQARMLWCDPRHAMFVIFVTPAHFLLLLLLLIPAFIFAFSPTRIPTFTST